MYRSRLQRIEEKRNAKRAVWFVALTIVILGATFVWGIPLLVKMVVFIGDLNSSKQPISNSDVIPPAPPQLVSSYDATNSALQTISGWTEPGATIYLTQNGNKTINVVAKDDGSFMFNTVTLLDGENDFVAVAMDQSGNKSLPSVGLKINYGTKSPNVDISSPSDKQVVNGGSARIEVKGKTDPGNRLTVNGRIIIVSVEGNFSTFVNLNQRDNTITIVSSDQMGNQTKKDVTVTYNP